MSGTEMPWCDPLSFGGGASLVAAPQGTKQHLEASSCLESSWLNQSLVAWVQRQPLCWQELC